MMRGFLRIVLFVVAGPYAGLLAIAVLIGSYTLITTGSTRDFVFGPELMSSGILIVAYSVGSVPALLTGIATAFVARWIAGWRYWLAMAAVGGLVSLAGAFVLIGGGPEMIGVREQAPMLVLVALAGAISAVVCAMVFDGLAGMLSRRRAD